jgi:hypothetical protein
MGKRCIVVGHRENVFHHLPFVEFYPDWDTAKQALNLATMPPSANGPTEPIIPY